MEPSCQPDLKVKKRPSEISAWLRGLLWICWVLEDTTSHSSQVLRTVKGLQWINKPDPFSPTHTCVQTLPLTWTHSSLPDTAPLAGVATSFVLAEAGEAHLPHRALGTEPTACCCSREDLFMVLNPQRTSLPSVGVHTQLEHSASVLLSRSAISLPLFIFTSLQAVSRGKGNNHTATQKAKQACFGKGK